tara:strand:- start:1708 stop:2340 length:633 start_codon:yes stop_codon:yes gene_type:complete
VIAFLKETDIQNAIFKSPNGVNTKFLQQSHSLWYRFNNYQKNAPYGLYKDGNLVSVIFATTSHQTKYINLYEIVTLQGQEGKGYATDIWSQFVEYWYDAGMKRIKLSCTPSSITWHMRNGLIFWAVDKQGSLRSDQPLKRTINEQVDFREYALTDPSVVLPDKKVRMKLREEDVETLQLSKKKILETYQAIKKVGEYWFRPYLYGLPKKK